MKSFIVVLFVIASAAVVLCDELAVLQGEITNGIPTTINSLLDNLNASMASGDLKKVTETLKSGEARLKELTQKVQSDKIRENLTKVQTDITQLVQKISSGEGNLDDVRAFINNARDKLKQHLADRIKSIGQEKKN